ncbi:hypothetical protein BV25DRAFT_25714 [Artomyces pyxidatus]|uniref:Uncharacterized protein n=1 Tax=Artomyces pyxidatus TaxID=48021 RepID=A0ACB8TJY8_9AGAM|nr:hypothetical protein BV25DRAFT_25714 [Artomyces pyxidatus]
MQASLAASALRASWGECTARNSKWQTSIYRAHSPSWRLALTLPLDPSAAHSSLFQGKDVDLLFGLDMLKAHQACIDLEKNVLRIQGREVSFLPEHELPENIKSDEELQAEAGPSNSGAGNPQSSFPGTGHSLQTPPNPSPAGRDTPSQPAAPEFPESAIQTLMGLGATRELAISTLSAAGGNLDVAASLLF